MTKESFISLQYTIEELISNHISFWSSFNDFSYSINSFICHDIVEDRILVVVFNSGNLYIKWDTSLSTYVVKPKNNVDAILYILEFIFNRHQQNINYMNVSMFKICKRIEEKIKYKIGPYKMYSKCDMVGSGIKIISEHENVPAINILYNKSNISLSNYRNNHSLYLLLDEKNTILEIDKYIETIFKQCGIRWCE